MRVLTELDLQCYRLEVLLCTVARQTSLSVLQLLLDLLSFDLGSTCEPLREKLLLLLLDLPLDKPTLGLERATKRTFDSHLDQEVTQVSVCNTLERILLLSLLDPVNRVDKLSDSPTTTTTTLTVGTITSLSRDRVWMNRCKWRNRKSRRRSVSFPPHSLFARRRC